MWCCGSHNCFELVSQHITSLQTSCMISCADCCPLSSDIGKFEQVINLGARPEGWSHSTYTGTRSTKITEHVMTDETGTESLALRLSPKLIPEQNPGIILLPRFSSTCEIGGDDLTLFRFCLPYPLQTSRHHILIRATPKTDTSFFSSSPSL